MNKYQSSTIPCTVGILTHNSDKTIIRALESVKDFAEIIVCDGSSTDDTLDIARAYHTKIITQDNVYLDSDGRLTDFAGVRNQCLDAATQEWFFFLDSDEWCGENLVMAIADKIKKNKLGAYFVNRLYVCGGVVIDCATTYPNRQMRFFARSTTERFIKKVHERIQMRSGVTPKIIEGALYVPMDDSIEQIRKKWDYYIAIEVARHTAITWGLIGHSIVRNSEISVLYVLRLLRIWLFCHGTRMPLSFELERHRYHFRSVIAFIRAKLKQ